MRGSSSRRASSQGRAYGRRSFDSVYARDRLARFPESESTFAMSAKIDGPFVAFPQDLLESPAWREAFQHPYIMSLLNFLNHEHMHHGAKENGNLVAPYKQLRRYCEDGGGIRAGATLPTIDIARRLGLIRVMAGGH